MTTKIEHVARSICASMHDDFNGWHSLGSDEIEQFKNAARAAIEAMRKPTDAMKSACGDGECRKWAPGAWVTMIDAALNEKERT